MAETEVVASSTDGDERDGPDYAAIEIPAEAPESYTYVQRRAELLQIVEGAGHPSAVNQTELAERYGVSQQQISKDLDRLDEFIRDRLGKRRDLQIGSVLKKCMTGALEEGDYSEARRAAVAYDEYLDNRIDTIEFRNRIERLEAAAEREERGGVLD
jgi:hypothetical protein